MTDAPDLGKRLLEYGARVIGLVERLPKTLAGRRIGDQLLRSATSVGARADFVHKLQVALKELRESNYWLRLLAKANVVPSEQLADIVDESVQLRAIVSKFVATAKRRSDAA